MPINLISIYCACQKVYKFEAWLDGYLLKYIKHNFKIVSSGLVYHDVGLYKFIGFNSSKNKPFYSYVAHAGELSKLWQEILGHLNYGKIQLLSKMLHGYYQFLPLKVNTKVLCLVNIIRNFFIKINLGVLINNCN